MARNACVFFCFTYKYLVVAVVVQGDPNGNFSFQIAIALKLCISDSVFVNPKCVWRVADFFMKIVNKQLNTGKNPPLLKHILALPMIGQRYFF